MCAYVNTIDTLHQIESMMTHRRTKKRHGGMRFSREALQYLIKRGVEHNEDYNDLNVMKFLIEHASGLRIVWDASTYSFIFELTFPPGLIDPYGLPLDKSVATLDAFTAAAAAAAAGGAPEPGTRVSTFCAKISFVYDGPDSLINEYKNVRKQTVPSHKANGEADTQRMLFEAFACRRTTAPFVPDVIAHAILTGPQFLAIFANILSSNVASTTPGVLGTPKEIYDWIDAWITSHGIMVDVILMEMMDFQRTAPGVARSQPFTIIHELRLRSQTVPHRLAALRMMAEIATVRGKGIMPHDFHEGNGLATADGLQLYLIDWGGLFNLNIQADRDRLLVIFDTMCRVRSRTETINATADAALVNPTESENTKRLARFPSLEELCGFLQIGFHDKSQPQHRSQNLHDLMLAFETRLMAVVDFTCVPPTLENVHSALMMVAFVDFMTNLMNFNHPYCQCGNVLKVVYPDQNVSVHIPIVDINVTPFNDFRLFLSTFQVGSVPSNTRLQEVVAMIEENVRLCPSACGGVPLPVSHLRANHWINDEIKKRRLAAAAEREAIRLAEEAKRLAAEAERSANTLTAKEEASRKRIANMRKQPKGVVKLLNSSKPEQVKEQAAQQPAPSAAASAAAAPLAPASAAPRSWLARVSSKFSSMRNWSLPAWLRKRQGGSRKQRKQRKSFTKRRHN